MKMPGLKENAVFEERSEECLADIVKPKMTFPVGTDLEESQHG